MLTNVKPTLGERVSHYLARVAHERLMRAGASETEAADLCEIAVVEIGNCENWKVDDARVYLETWREGRRLTAAQFRADRTARLEAGYRSAPVADPVYLNGGTAW